jgi:lipoprotein-releasing system permease protein
VRLPLYIAKRYLFAKKSRNAINVISAVSVAGVTVGTMALIIILSVFNGLEKMVTGIFNTFDPQIKITAAVAKTFVPDSSKIHELSRVKGVEAWSFTIEENSLIRYGERQIVGWIKGVDDNYSKVSEIDSSMWEGEFRLRSENGRQWAIPGIGVAQSLGIRINFVQSLEFIMPRRTAGLSLNPETALKTRHLLPSGIFEVEKEYDSKYVYVPLDFARELIESDSAVTDIEIKLRPGTNDITARNEIKKIFGSDFKVQTRLEQQAIFYKVMRSERFAIFLILTLILIIASFNITGSLTMLMIEKQRDIDILRSLGAHNDLIRKIFIFEGWLISISGAIAGVVLGFIICWLQQTYGLVKLESQSLIMTSYPVVLKARDFILVPATVLIIGYWAAWYPVRFLTKRYLSKDV